MVRAIEIVAELRRRGRDVRLLVAGLLDWKGAAADIARTVRALGVETAVEVLPPYTQREAPAIFQRAHVLLHLKYKDPCPTVVIEAWPAGCPSSPRGAAGCRSWSGTKPASFSTCRIRGNRSKCPTVDDRRDAVTRLMGDHDRWRDAARGTRRAPIHERGVGGPASRDLPPADRAGLSSGARAVTRADDVPITILMPVYNVERYLRGALDSLFRQTWQDFELLIVNDGSTDGTRAILAEIQDSRVRVIDMPHGGLAAALRCGVEQARGGYIARMDADDEALPIRLAVQKACLDRFPHVVLVHSLAQPMDLDGRRLPMVLGDPRPSTVTKWLLQWQNPIVHPTVMLRRDDLRTHDLNYRLEFFRADEFDLWNRLAPHGDFEAIPEVLHRTGSIPQSMTLRNPVDLHLAAFTRVIHENFERLRVPLSPSAAEELAVISGGTWLDPSPMTTPI